MSETLSTTQDKKQVYSSYVKENGAPAALVIDITTKCDIGSCAHCYISDVDHDKGVFIDKKVVKEWQDVLKESMTKPKEIWLTGGEPTMNPDLPELINSLGDDYHVALVTNGENLADPNFCKELIENSKLKEVAITFRGFKSLHDYFITQKLDEKHPHYDKTIQAIVNLSKYNNLKISLNIDMQDLRDMDKIVNDIIENDGRVDTLLIQIQRNTTKVVENDTIYGKNFTNQLRTPNFDMVKTYIEQANTLINEKKVKYAVIIDPVRSEIYENLNLKDEPIYDPQATPAIGVDGTFRADVLNYEQRIKNTPTTFPQT
jgi:sulfatase maturation enzyme AslB (radical SAM superfamily)